MGVCEDKGLKECPGFYTCQGLWHPATCVNVRSPCPEIPKCDEFPVGDPCAFVDCSGLSKNPEMRLLQYQCCGGSTMIFGGGATGGIGSGGGGGITPPGGGGGFGGIGGAISPPSFGLGGGDKLLSPRPRSGISPPQYPTFRNR